MPASLERRSPRRAALPVVAVMVLALLAPAARAAAQPTEKLTVSVTGGSVSLEAVDAPLDRVLMKLGEALRARIVIETVLAGDLGKTRITRSFTGVSADHAFRRLLVGRNYALVQGPAGVDEVRVFVDGSTGYRDLAAPERPGRPAPRSSRPTAEGPADDPAEVARLRQAALDAPDASARRQALEELSGISDSGIVRETLAQVLARERDSRVLETVLALGSQQEDGLPSEALRAFVTSDRDAAARALAVDQLAAQAGADPATRSVLRSLAAGDASADVREAAKIALEILETPDPPVKDGARPARSSPNRR